MLISLSGEVNDEMYVKLFGVYQTLQQAGTKINDDILDIFLNTEGGDTYQGLAIYDLIQLIRKYIKVRVICAGYVASSGITVLLSADIRAALENSTLMIHYGEMSCNGLSEQNHNRKLVDLHLKMLYNNLYVSDKTIKLWHDGDHFFNTSRALEVGLIDEIL